MSLPPSGQPVQTVGLFEYYEANGQRFKRKRGTEEWVTVLAESLETESPPQQQPLLLWLALEHQAPGEPNHWFLFVGRENEAGMVYREAGDARCVTYEPLTEPVHRPWISPTLLTMYELATLTDQMAVVQEVTEREPPPRAETRRDVKENCQGWCVRVLANLVERGLEAARSMVEPV
ncbi:hypothetical protein AJ80_02534 [Polytolypa hystricis UAMH7299]|uniref:Uncharacterized protein n=1 Tax=Polytolypa hystricis (strain UAMH7299) TaxID=1447883 RepID=A0A2B7YH66_POLH7|nr:hypothetical protein AJ80_02534 [Polytolypa hystricis UAMH7299]